MSKYIIDFQGFHCENDSYIIKELTIIDLDRDYVLHHLVLPPFDVSLLNEKEQKQVYWLQKYYHKINWNDGQLEYNQLFATLRNAVKDASVIYVKGSERASFLRKVTSKFVIDLDKLDCPRACHLPLPKISKMMECCYKTHSFDCQDSGICSLERALKYKFWLRNFFDNGVDEVDFSSL